MAFEKIGVTIQSFFSGSGALFSKLFFMRVNAVSLGLFVAIIQMLIYSNLSAFLPAESIASAENLIIFYMLLTLVFTVASRYVPPDSTKPFWQEMITFVVSFFIFAGFLVAVPFGASAQIFQGVDSTIPTGIVATALFFIFAFVIAYPEEYVFRGILPKFLGPILSAILFAVFHWSVYHGNFVSLLTAFIFGLMFWFFKEKFGLMSAVGMHTAWNLMLLGAFKAFGFCIGC